MIQKYTATITTDGSGDATVYLGSSIRGRVLAMKYAPGNIATGAKLVISGESSEVPVLTKNGAGTSTVWYHPLAPATKVADGGASALMEVPVHLYRERAKLVVSGGGDTKSGEITLYVDE